MYYCASRFNVLHTAQTCPQPDHQLHIAHHHHYHTSPRLWWSILSSVIFGARIVDRLQEKVYYVIKHIIHAIFLGEEFLCYVMNTN
jgi:hypothetical protein